MCRAGLDEVREDAEVASS